MSIPTIAPYQLPQTVPAGIADPPCLDASRTAVLVHDMQHYFLRPFRDLPQHDLLISNAARVIASARACDAPVIYTAQPGDMTQEQRGLLQRFWGPGMSADPTDRGFVNDIAPQDTDVRLTKWRYSAFHGTDLLEQLRSQGRNQLVIVGVYAHLGIMISAVDAMSNGILPYVITDAVADFGPSEHAMCLDFVAKRCGVTLTTADLTSVLSAQGRREAGKRA